MLKQTGRKIIVFYSPYSGAGKTTAAEYMVKGFGAVHLSFADPLYWMLGEVLFPPDFRSMDKDELHPEIGGHSFREFMIAFGQAGKSVWPDIWVEGLSRRLEKNGFIVIDDLRFPNEYKMLREEGAKIVRITNPDREVVPGKTEALLEGYDFDAEILNKKMGQAEYIKQINHVVMGLWPGLRSE